MNLKTGFGIAKAAALALAAAAVFLPSVSAAGDLPVPAEAEDSGRCRASLGDSAFVPVPADAWDFDDLSWKADGETLISSGHGLFASAQEPSAELELCAPVRPERCRNPARAALGIVAYGSAGDYWQLALVKAAGSAGAGHRFEMRAMSGGVWGAERRDARLLEIRDCGAWEFGREYELSLLCGPDRAVGQVTDRESGDVVFRAVWGPAPADGGGTVFAASSAPGYRPGLCVEGFFRGRVAGGMLARGAGAPRASSGEPLPECVPVAGRNDAGALVAALLRFGAVAAGETGGPSLLGPPAPRDVPGTGMAGLRGEAAAEWNPDGPEPDGGAEAEADAAADRSRRRSFAAAPGARAESCASGLPGPGGPLVAPPRSGAWAFSRWVDRHAAPRAGLGQVLRDGGAQTAGTLFSPSLRASGVPAGGDAPEWKHEPPPEEVAAGPPAAA